MTFHNYIKILIFLWQNTESSLALLETPVSIDSDMLNNDVFRILNTKDYLPNEYNLPKSRLLENVDNEVTYILSKLSDEELIQLLTQQPKKYEYDLNDLAKIAINTKEVKSLQSYDEPRIDEPQKAFFKLDNKEVESFGYNNNADLKYNAFQKLNNILYSRPQKNSEENDGKNEMLFDVLVAQLKTLCCRKHKAKTNNRYKLESVLKNTMAQKKTVPHEKPKTMEKSKEHIFLIINDEINGNNVTDQLIAVDPNSLAENSSVLLLGPITTPFSNAQLKLVMSRIALELSKPEYLPLLQKLAGGVFRDGNLGLMKSIITGPDSRRYIKPHRCNHQSKLARVHGGPKWLICTGYLNVNTPSLYD